MEESIAKKRKLNRTKPESWNDVTFTASNTNGSKEIFEAVRMGSVDVLKKLLATNGLDVTSKLAQSYNEEGETPLLVAIKCKHLNVVEFLVKNLKVNFGQIGRFFWKTVDYSEVLPLFASIISDQRCIMKYLFTEEMKYKPSISLDSIMSSSIPRPQKIDQLELMGATFILFKNVSSNPQGVGNDPDELLDGSMEGWMCWKEAMTLRLCPADGEPQIPKIPFQLSDRGRKALGDVVEPMTLEQVEQSSNSPSLIGEAFLVAIRYLSRAGLFPNLFIPDCFYSHFLCESYKDIVYVFKQAMYLLEMLEPCKWEDDIQQFKSSTVQDFDFDFNSSNSALHTISSVIQTIGTSLDPTYSEGVENIPEQTDFEDCMFIFDFCCNHIRRVFAQFDDQLTILAPHFIGNKMGEVTHLLIGISGFIDLILLPQLSAEESQQFNNCITEFIHLCDETGTPRDDFFHRFCCLTPSYHLGNVGVTIQYCIDSGLLDPNAVDYEGDTVLHHLINLLDLINELSFSSGEIKMNFVAKLVVQMLDNGGQIDIVNNDGKTVRGILRNLQSELDGKGYLNHPGIDSVVNRPALLPLTSCCAQLIRKLRIPFENLELPSSLKLFLRRGF